MSLYSGIKLSIAVQPENESAAGLSSSTQNEQVATTPGNHLLSFDMSFGD